MSKIKTFMDLLKEDNVAEAFQVIKDEMSERARALTEASNIEVAKKFNMTPIVEEKDEDEKDDDENLSDEEKEAKKAKKAEEEGK